MILQLRVGFGEAAEVLRRSTVQASSGGGLRKVAMRAGAALRAAA